MKYVIAVVLAVLVFPFTTGMSIIDKDTKKTVEELNYKIEKLLQYEHADHAEEMKAVKEQKDELDHLSTRMDALEKRQRALSKDMETPNVVDAPQKPVGEVKQKETPAPAAAPTAAATPIPTTTTSPAAKPAMPTTAATASAPTTASPIAAVPTAATMSPAAVVTTAAPTKPTTPTPAPVATTAAPAATTANPTPAKPAALTPVPTSVATTSAPTPVSPANAAPTANEAVATTAAPAKSATPMASSPVPVTATVESPKPATAPASAPTTAAPATNAAAPATVTAAPATVQEPAKPAAPAPNTLAADLMKTQKKAQTELALPFPPKKPEELKKPVAPSSVKAEPQQVQQSESVLPYFISGFSIFLMIVLFIRMKKSEERIKTMLWRADMETLREDLARERNKVNPKIHVTGETAKVHLP